ncbi:MAG: DsbA family protein [Acidobacteria bacterium]|nr:DsbA family protein [Acidobacteriota bacterium]
MAVVKGKPITETDLRASAAEQATALEREYKRSRQQLLEDTLETLLQDRLIKAEAAARGITKEAVLASLCAAEQGKFWEMYDAIFANQKALAVKQLKARVAQLGLNAAQFSACLDVGKYAEAVQFDIKDGTGVGVNGTPALFINGRFISGAVPLEPISEVVDDELRRKGSH